MQGEFGTKIRNDLSAAKARAGLSSARQFPKDALVLYVEALEASLIDLADAVDAKFRNLDRDMGRKIISRL